MKRKRQENSLTISGRCHKRARGEQYAFNFQNKNNSLKRNDHCSHIHKLTIPRTENTRNIFPSPDDFSSNISAVNDAKHSNSLFKLQQNRKRTFSEISHNCQCFFQENDSKICENCNIFFDCIDHNNKEINSRKRSRISLSTPSQIQMYRKSQETKWNRSMNVQNSSPTSDAEFTYKHYSHANRILQELHEESSKRHPYFMEDETLQSQNTVEVCSPIASPWFIINTEQCDGINSVAQNKHIHNDDFTEYSQDNVSKHNATQDQQCTSDDKNAPLEFNKLYHISFKSSEQNITTATCSAQEHISKKEWYSNIPQSQIFPQN